MSTSTKQAYGRMKKYSLDLRRYYREPAAQVSLSIVLSLFIVAFFITVALRPTFATIAELNQELEESQKSLQQLESKAATLQQAASIWEKVQTKLPYIEAAIPSEAIDYQRLSQVLEVIAQEEGVVISSETMDGGVLYSSIAKVYEKKKSNEPTELKVGIRVVGGYRQLRNFLGRVMQDERLIEIRNITITRETGEGNLGMSIDGVVRYLANSSELTRTIGGEK